MACKPKNKAACHTVERSRFNHHLVYPSGKQKRGWQPCMLSETGYYWQCCLYGCGLSFYTSVRPLSFPPSLFFSLSHSLSPSPSLCVCVCICPLLSCVGFCKIRGRLQEFVEEGPFPLHSADPDAGEVSVFAKAG